MNFRLLMVTAAIAASIAGAASAAQYDITIDDGVDSLTATLAQPFTPHVGCSGCTADQSWGFGANSVSDGGWLDFFSNGTQLQTEGGSFGNVTYISTQSFYTLSGTTPNYSLSALTPGAYSLTDGGALIVSEAPEPAVWTLMFLGLGGAGLAMRNAKRKDLGAVAAA